MDRSMIRKSSAVGTPTAIGLVPKMGSVVPCGATYSGDWLMATPISPWRAIASTQYLHIPLSEGQAYGRPFLLVQSWET